MDLEADLDFEAEVEAIWNIDAGDIGPLTSRRGRSILVSRPPPWKKYGLQFSYLYFDTLQSDLDCSLCQSVIL